MNFFAAIINGLGEIWGHKLRSLLTLVCVLLGVASMVLVQGFIDGLFDGWRSSIEEQGGVQLITVTTSFPPENQRVRMGISPGLTVDDAKVLRDSCEGIDAISPLDQLNDSTLRRGKKTFRCRQLLAGWSDIFTIRRFEIESGRALADLDNQNRAQVIVLGAGVVEALFREDEDPLGKSVDVQGVPFTVVGVLVPYEKWFGSFNLLRDKNETAFIPLNTALQKVGGTTRPDTIEIRAESLENVPETAAAIQNVMLRLHRGIEDTRVTSLDSQIAAFRDQKAAFMIGGVAIAAVSLLVSGIGIMNLMLAAIHERVREIGVRKALGAWSRDIFTQFIVEACTLSIMGGLFGIAMGYGIIHLLQGLEVIRPIFSANAALVGFGFSVTVGISAGLYPAIQASRLDPIDALRYE